MLESLSSGLISLAPYPSLLSYTAVAGFLFLTYAYFVHPFFLSELRAIPPAHPFALTPLWIIYHRYSRLLFSPTAISLRSQALRPIHRAHTKHGPIIRLSPTEISVAGYEAVYRVYVEKGGFAKPDWWATEFMTFGVRNLVSFVGGPGNREHAGRRRDLGGVYAKGFLVNSGTLKDIARVVLERTVRVLESVVDGGDKHGKVEGTGTGTGKGMMDVYTFNGAVNADFASAYLFGTAQSTDFTCEKKARDEYFRHHNAFLNGDQDKSQKWLENLALEKCSHLDVATGLKHATDARVEGAEDAVVYKQLIQRGVHNAHLASELLDHLIAGAEAPRTTLTYLQWELSKNPGLQSRLRAEAQTLIPPSSPSLSADDLRIPDLKALDALPLLSALLTETLRVYTPTPGPQHRVVPPEGTALGGHFVPGGTEVSACFGVLHMNPDVFPEPEAWKPERWLGGGVPEGGDGGTEGGTEEMRRWFWAFNKGARGCVGKDFTVIVMKLIVATMYARYETSVVEDDGMEPSDGFLAHPVGEKLVLKFTRVG
ncbi:cytochrome P450 [Lentithecium fluviatile CBS 122367]|uniref:Cytochrome P450 n=1 Tax=Lentithecium fluviatile CBS 122367 TaxID=1168545 RepID=A0A6G1J7T8_9PLEO|nr:cytochrome P450 [Lentithecium fluviatile CBS 122367]